MSLAASHKLAAGCYQKLPGLQYAESWSATPCAPGAGKEPYAAILLSLYISSLRQYCSAVKEAGHVGPAMLLSSAPLRV